MHNSPVPKLPHRRAYHLLPVHFDNITPYTASAVPVHFYKAALLLWDYFSPSVNPLVISPATGFLRHRRKTCHPAGCHSLAYGTSSAGGGSTVIARPANCGDEAIPLSTPKLLIKDCIPSYSPGSTVIHPQEDSATPKKNTENAVHSLDGIKKIDNDPQLNFGKSVRSPNEENSAYTLTGSFPKLQNVYFLFQNTSKGTRQK